jgi:uncharacterized membrane protein YkvA (DUF1232 family)
VAYALSPIDLILDFIPVLGYLDELVLVPLGVALVLKLVPAEILADARRRAEQTRTKLNNWFAATVIAMIWLIAAAVIAWIRSSEATVPRRRSAETSRTFCRSSGLPGTPRRGTTC